MGVVKRARRSVEKIPLPRAKKVFLFAPVPEHLGDGRRPNKRIVKLPTVGQEQQSSDFEIGCRPAFALDVFDHVKDRILLVLLVEPRCLSFEIVVIVPALAGIIASKEIVHPAEFHRHPFGDMGAGRQATQNCYERARETKMTIHSVYL